MGSDDGRVDEIEDGAQALRLKLRSSRDSRRRVPEELRAEAVAFARATHVSGERYKSIASALGLKPDTLMRWCRRGREPKKFTPVVVKGAVAVLEPPVKPGHSTQSAYREGGRQGQLVQRGSSVSGSCVFSSKRRASRRRSA